MHPEIPPELWTPWCPFRALQESRVLPWLLHYGRWQRYGAAILGPDPDERTLQAFDVMTWALRRPTLAQLKARQKG